jgi:hypothetical protein
MGIVSTSGRQSPTQRKLKMTITATVKVGFEFGTSGRMVTETKVFTSMVDYQAFMSLKKEFDAEDEVINVKWDCK